MLVEYVAALVLGLIIQYLYFHIQKQKLLEVKRNISAEIKEVMSMSAERNVKVANALVGIQNWLNEDYPKYILELMLTDKNLQEVLDLENINSIDIFKDIVPSIQNATAERFQNALDVINAEFAATLRKHIEEKSNA